MRPLHALLLVPLGGCLIGWDGIDPVGHDFEFVLERARLGIRDADGELWPAEDLDPRAALWDRDSDRLPCTTPSSSGTREPEWEHRCRIPWTWDTLLIVELADERHRTDAITEPDEVLGGWRLDARDLMEVEPDGAITLSSDDGVVEELLLSVQRI